MIKLFGFVKARDGQPARLVRVEATGRMPREELRRKLMAISARKQRAYGSSTTGKARDEQPPSTLGREWSATRGQRTILATGH